MQRGRFEVRGMNIALVYGIRLANKIKVKIVFITFIFNNYYLSTWISQK
jgi:hypothetical protein